MCICRKKGSRKYRFVALWGKYNAITENTDIKEKFCMFSSPCFLFPYQIKWNTWKGIFLMKLYVSFLRRSYIFYSVRQRSANCQVVKTHCFSIKTQEPVSIIFRTDSVKVFLQINIFSFKSKIFRKKCFVKYSSEMNHEVVSLRVFPWALSVQLLVVLQTLQ